MNALTTSLVDRAPFLLLCFACACGGKSNRAPAPTIGNPPSRSLPAPAPAPPVVPPAVVVPPLSERLADDLAPEPRIRVGLSTSAEVVRLTSSRPFRVGAGVDFVETNDVLVERELGAVIGAKDVTERFIYRVMLGSFPTEAAAAEFRSRAQEENVEELTISREPETGRYSLRAGNFSTESGASVEKLELERLGYEDLAVIREPARSPRPTALRLLARGRTPLRVSSLGLRAVPTEPGASLEVDGRPYRGYLEVTVNASNELTLVNVVNLEDYLRGVVPAELSPDAFPEKDALKAQAVAARTYAVKRLGQFASDGYDLCATPACQVYRGVGAERPLSDEAVSETAGEVLTYDGQPIDALYTSTCGGRTENAENVFSEAKPYLVSRACFLEGRGAPVVVSRNDGPLPLETALLLESRILEGRPGNGSATYAQAKGWVQATVGALGQSPCWSRSTGAEVDGRSSLDVAGLASLLGQALCWERRLPFLLSELDAERIVGPGVPADARISLANAVLEGLIIPAEEGIRLGTSISRQEVIQTLYRLLEERGEPSLREARVVSVDSSGLVLAETSFGGGEDTETSMGFSPVRYLYRDVSDRAYYAERLTILPNDRVRFHAGDGGIDLLVLRSQGFSFDRTSRFSHWVVRKTADELNREVNLRNRVGAVRELRPIRYGPSGRIVELGVVGSAASATLRGLDIRRALGIRENLFFFDTQRGSDGTARGWVFTGRGWGHGVGLCQVGAYGMAASGFGYREILAHYYPGTAIAVEQLRFAKAPRSY